MKKTAEQKIRRFRKKRIWPSVIFFIFALTIGLILIVFFSSGFLASVLEGKYSALDGQANIYRTMLQVEAQSSGDYQSILNRLSMDKRNPEAMTVMDKDGNTIAFYGPQTMHMEREVTFDLLDENHFYLDEVDVDVADGRGIIEINMVELGERVFDPVNFLYQEDGRMMKDETESVLSISLWIQKPIDEQGVNLFVKEDLNIHARELIILFLVAAISAVMIFLMLTIVLINDILHICNQRMLSKTVFMDTVTGGNNWLYFENQGLKRLCRRANAAKSYAVVDFTLMKYRSFCTLYGVKEGEHLLEKLNDYLSKGLKRGEICARYGKSSFALLLKVEKDDAEYRALTKRLEAMTNRFGEGFIFHVGVALVEPSINESGKNVKRKNIDFTRYYNDAGIARATIGENEGSQIVFFNHQMWEAQVWEHKVEATMQEALDHEEFQVYIQPKINPMTEKLAGAEALVRWISPTEGFISPGKFIPIFEKTGFVTKLDDYMISHVAKLQAQWLAEGKPIVPISVNVSRAHFAQLDLAEHIMQLVDEYKVPHEYIEIELTESAFFDDKQVLLTTVKKLQSYGFEVSMDDFGSGYSSLNSLKDLPLDVLKLDAEFFRGEDENHRGEIVVSRAIALAKQLNMRIVAEGVEKKEQVEFLAQQECDMIQGFYYAKPMPANEYEAYL